MIGSITRSVAFHQNPGLGLDSFRKLGTTDDDATGSTWSSSNSVRWVFRSRPWDVHIHRSPDGPSAGLHATRVLGLSGAPWGCTCTSPPDWYRPIRPCLSTARPFVALRGFHLLLSRWRQGRSSTATSPSLSFARRHPDPDPEPQPQPRFASGPPVCTVLATRGSEAPCTGRRGWGWGWGSGLGLGERH